MSRDLVMLTVAFVLGSGALWLAGWLPAAPADARLPEAASGVALERRAWRRLLLAFVPIVLVFATLLGWGLQEPAQTDEPLRPLVALVVAPAVLLWARALARAVRALRRPRSLPALATLGLVRPRIVMGEGVARTLDASALEAALAHERAHARHRDPLRIWLAQLATDLQWPSPFARRRFDRWLAALELARDEEARRDGARGADLAAAIVAVAKLGAAGSGGAVAALGGPDRLLACRIHRLLRPLSPSEVASPLAAVCALSAAVACAVLIGVTAGDVILRALPIIRS
ncbi:MAG TPA: M56 family metallopeptidase [Polyangia bacterium]|nr:M56 family metallopeptidase [Polyangia bacterium]